MSVLESGYHRQYISKMGRKILIQILDCECVYKKNNDLIFLGADCLALVPSVSSFHYLNKEQGRKTENASPAVTWSRNSGPFV